MLPTYIVAADQPMVTLVDVPDEGEEHE